MNQGKEMSGLYNGTSKDKEKRQVIECKLTVNEVESAHTIQLRSQARMLPGLRGPSPVTCYIEILQFSTET